MTQKALPNPGEYPAKLKGGIIIYIAESGALCASMRIQIIGSEIPWSGKHTMTLAKSDGTLQAKTIETLKAVFGWDGVNPFGLSWENPDEPNDDKLVPRDLTEVEFEIVGEHREMTPRATQDNPDPEPVTVFDIKWLNPVGGGASNPTPANRKEVLANLGSKFKALSKPAAKAPAGKPAQTQQAAKAPVTSSSSKAAPQRGAPPARGKSNATVATARTSSSDEVYTALFNQNEEAEEDAKLNEADLGEKFYAAQDKVAPGANGELTPAQWGAVADELGV